MPNFGLTPTTKEYLLWIGDFIDELHLSPSYGTIAEEFDCTISTVQAHVASLKHHGFIDTKPGVPRSITLTKKGRKYVHKVVE